MLHVPKAFGLDCIAVIKIAATINFLSVVVNELYLLYLQ